MKVQRVDAGSLAPPTEEPNGWLRADGYLTKVGIFTYRFSDGTIRREYRPPDEVFAGPSLDSFRLVPVTDDHPPVFLDATNTRAYSVGVVGENVGRDGDLVRASLRIMDAATIQRMREGKRQLSCGYTADLDLVPGEVDGEQYDAVQRNIRGNHVAIVDVARAGPEAAVRLDSATGIMVQPEPDPTRGAEMQTTGSVTTTPTPPASSEADALRADVARVTAERDALQARLDAASREATSEAATKAKAAEVERLRAEVRARLALEATAARLVKDAAVEGKTDREIRTLVLGELAPDFKADGRSDEYLAARFDAEVERADKAGAAQAAAREAAVGSGAPREDADPEKAARARMVEANRNAWKAPTA